MRQLTHREVAFGFRKNPIHLVCPDWQDPRNVGSAFRLADAAGLSGLILSGKSPCPPHSKIAKTARSTERTVPWSSTDDLLAELKEAKGKGAYLMALEITDESQSLLEFDLPPISSDHPLYLIAGNEASGVAQELLDICDVSVHLPMYGQNTSMNVAVALGAAVYLLLGNTA
ncbi:RNA methyltransferase [Lewinellaceae bacterium SD302]|nr:RNA methyltransferase [Lewinellaceae bacterium SD302]